MGAFINHFGTNAVLLTSTASVTASAAAPKVVISLADLENVADGGQITGGVGFNDVSLITDVTKDDYAPRIQTALLRHLEQSQSLTVEDDATVAIYIFLGDGNRQFVTRTLLDGTTESQIAHYPTLAIHTPDTTGSLDPDDVI